MVTEFRFPDVGEGIHEGTIVKWLVKEGDKVKVDQPLLEMETDKAIVELPSPVEGTVLKVNFKQGEVVSVGDVMIVIGDKGEKIKTPAMPARRPQEVKKPEPKAAPGRVLAAPATRKLARDLEIDITKIHGTGPAGRVTVQDVRKAASQEARETTPPVHVISEGDEERVKLSGIRKVIAERMTYSKTHIPHACGMDFVDVTRLVQIREKEKRIFESKGIKLTYLPFIIKACIIALKRYPQFNAHFDEENGEIVFKKHLNIGIAVDTPEGLTVPVIHDVERKSMVAIAKEITELAQLARERKLSLDNIKDGTFTITNVGSVGGMYSTPIINPPEIAIMGVHRIKDMPLVVNGEIKARKVMGISMCFDHRVADGAAATEFINVVKRHLEDPDLLLVDMI